MNELIKSVLPSILSSFAENVVTASNVQYVLRLLTARLRSLAKETETALDDVALSFLDGIVTSWDKADAVAAWIQDLLIPNRCQAGEEQEIPPILSGGKAEFLEAAAWFAGCVLPILVTYFKPENENEQDKTP